MLFVRDRILDRKRKNYRIISSIKFPNDNGELSRAQFTAGNNEAPVERHCRHEVYGCQLVGIIHCCCDATYCFAKCPALFKSTFFKRIIVSQTTTLPCYVSMASLPQRARTRGTFDRLTISSTVCSGVDTKKMFSMSLVNVQV